MLSPFRKKKGNDFTVIAFSAWNDKCEWQIMEIMDRPGRKYLEFWKWGNFVQQILDIKLLLLLLNVVMQRQRMR